MNDHAIELRQAFLRGEEQPKPSMEAKVTYLRERLKTAGSYILDESFKYVPSDHTDLAETFRKARAA